MCEHDIYALPTLEFVGGSTQSFAFHAYYYKGKREMDLSGCDATFSVLEYSSRNGDPLLSKKMTPADGSSSGLMSVISITLEPNDTLALCGKYIYQITIEDVDGRVDIPKQGIMRVIGNIDKKLIS